MVHIQKKKKVIKKKKDIKNLFLSFNFNLRNTWLEFLFVIKATFLH